jgi:pantothenate synthetase
VQTPTSLQGDYTEATLQLKVKACDCWIVIEVAYLALSRRSNCASEKQQNNATALWMHYMSARIFCTTTVITTLWHGMPLF